MASSTHNAPFAADTDKQAQQEWYDAFDDVLRFEGQNKPARLLGDLAARLTQTGAAALPFAVTTPYRNTIPAHEQAPMPGDLFMERRIRSLIRWNALAMVVRANNRPGDLGGISPVCVVSNTLRCRL